MATQETILITGGAGFIGSSLARAANQAGHHVIVLDTLSPQIHGDDPASSSLLAVANEFAEVVKGDVRNAELVAELVARSEVVVHLAAETGTGQSMYQISDYISVNLDGTGVVLEAVAGCADSVRKLVVASSRAVYGEGAYHCAEHGVVYPEERLLDDLRSGHFEPRCPICNNFCTAHKTDETTPHNATSLYGITKSSQELLTLNVGKTLGMSTTALRLQNVYGPGQSLSNPYTGILSIFSTLIRSGKSIEIYEDGKESRDFVFIDDVVAAFMAAIANTDATQQALNIGTGVPTSVARVVELLMQQLDIQTEATTTGRFRVGDIRHNFADLQQASSALGFAPTVSIETGLASFCDWVETQPVPQSRYDESAREMQEKGILEGPTD